MQHRHRSKVLLYPTPMHLLILFSVSVCLPIMRPLFVNRVPYPVRSRFSAFRFSASKPGTKGVSRAVVDEGHGAQNWSGKTLTSIGLKPLPRSHSVKVGNEINITLASQGADQALDDETRSHESEPWGQNVGSPSIYQEWQLDVIPTWTSLESGIRADGRLAKWAI